MPQPSAHQAVVHHSRVPTPGPPVPGAGAPVLSTARVRTASRRARQAPAAAIDGEPDCARRSARSSATAMATSSCRWFASTSSGEISSCTIRRSPSRTPCPPREDSGASSTPLTVANPGALMSSPGKSVASSGTISALGTPSGSVASTMTSPHARLTRTNPLTSLPPHDARHRSGRSDARRAKQGPPYRARSR